MIKPLFNRIIVQKEELSNKTESGILIGNEHKESPSIGKIIAVGSDISKNDKYKDYQKDLQVGSLVFFKPYSATAVEYKDDEYLVLEVEDVLAKIKEEV